MLDQPSNAQRLVELGVAARPLPFAKLSAPALAARVTEVLGDEGMRARAAGVAAGIAEWRGVAAAADLVLGAAPPWAALKAAGVLA